MWRNVANLFVVLVAGAGGFGCAQACDTSDQPPTRYEDGVVVNGIYSSSSAHAKLLHFPGGKRYDVVHHLGFEPILVQMYWSFTESGIGEYQPNRDTSSLSLAAGNSALIQLKNSEFIQIKNDSCAEFWLLVVASGDPRQMDSGPADMTDAAPE